MKRIYKTSFDAAHFIKDHPKCGQLHGHTYHIEVIVDRDGWLDFNELREVVDTFLKSRYDHKNLGNKTCEEIAEDIYHRVGFDFKCVQVRVFETGHFGVEYP